MADRDEPAPHLCRVHTKEEEPLLFVCLTEACFSQGLLCFHCRMEKHNGGAHNIKALDQLKKEAVNTAYDKSAPNSVQEHLHFLKDARQKCLTGIRETHRSLEQVVKEAEQSVIARFDQLEEDAAKIFENAGEERFQPRELDMRLPTGELNQNAIDTMREIVSRKLRGGEINNIRQESTAAVQKSEVNGLDKLRELSQLAAERVADLLKPLEELHESLNKKV